MEWIKWNYFRAFRGTFVVSFSLFELFSSCCWRRSPFFSLSNFIRRCIFFQFNSTIEACFILSKNFFVSPFTLFTSFARILNSRSRAANETNIVNIEMRGRTKSRAIATNERIGKRRRIESKCLTTICIWYVLRADGMLGERAIWKFWLKICFCWQMLRQYFASANWVCANGFSQTLKFDVRQ